MWSHIFYCLKDLSTCVGCRHVALTWGLCTDSNANIVRSVQQRHVELEFLWRWRWHQSRRWFDNLWTQKAKNFSITIGEDMRDQDWRTFWTEELLNSTGSAEQFPVSGCKLYSIWKCTTCARAPGSRDFFLLFLQTIWISPQTERDLSALSVSGR